MPVVTLMCAAGSAQEGSGPANLEEAMRHELHTQRELAARLRLEVS